VLLQTTFTSEADPLWSKPCRAYNLHAELHTRCREDLVEVQDRLDLPSWALRCPSSSLHLSVATLLSVREDYGTSKDVVWALSGGEWSESLRELVAGLQPFEVSFTRLQVRRAAIIALATPVPEVDEIRGRARHLLLGAGLKPDQPSIIHCTLVRYGLAGLNLEALARSARGVELSVKTTVTQLVISKESVYPNLVRETLGRLQLGVTAASVAKAVRRTQPQPKST